MYDQFGEVDGKAVRLQALTGLPWTREHVIALGASFCNDWPRLDNPEAPELAGLSPEGEQQWAEAVASPLGFPIDATLAAIKSREVAGFHPCQ